MSTGITWTEETWNPIVGCSIVSKGCTNCYAMQWAGQRMDGNPRAPHYAGTTKQVNGHHVWTGKLARAPEATLLKPLRWTRPRMIFVNSMSDLFHEAVPDDWIDQIFAVMALTPQHTYQILTKRPERMKAYMSDAATRGRILDLALLMKELPHNWAWPLNNVWLGVSIEDQATADERIPKLLTTPAAVRWISAEPLLGPIDLTDISPSILTDPDLMWDALSGDLNRRYLLRRTFGDKLKHHSIGNISPRLDWVVAGGESGSASRPMHPDWPRSIRDQCADAGTSFFFKQWGEWAPSCDGVTATARIPLARRWPGVEAVWSWRVGKRIAGDLLDGVQHHNWPKEVV